MVSFDIIFFPFQNPSDIVEYISLDIIVFYMQYHIFNDPTVIKLLDTGYDVFVEENQHTFNFRVNGYGDKVDILFEYAKNFLS